MTKTADDAPRGLKLPFVTLALALWAAAYVAVHIYLPEPLPSNAPGCSRDLGWRCFAERNEQGQVRILDPRLAAWYLGGADYQKVAWRLEANFVRMLEIRDALQEELADSVSGLLIDRAPVIEVIEALQRGDDALASVSFQVVLESLSLASQHQIAIRLSRIQEGLERLRQLDFRQTTLMESLSAPWPSSFFWKLPPRGLLELMFWAGFGALFSLAIRLVSPLNSARKVPGDDPVFFFQFVYGPISAVFFSAILYEAWLRAGPRDLWIGWLLITAFLLGYGSDGLIHRLSEWTRRGRLSSGPTASSARATIQQQASVSFSTKIPDLNQRPADLAQMRTDLKRWTHDFVEARVIDRGVK